MAFRSRKKERNGRMTDREVGFAKKKTSFFGKNGSESRGKRPGCREKNLTFGLFPGGEI